MMRVRVATGWGTLDGAEGVIVEIIPGERVLVLLDGEDRPLMFGRHQVRAVDAPKDPRPPAWLKPAADWLLARMVGRATALEVGVPAVTTTTTTKR